MLPQDSLGYDLSVPTASDKTTLNPGDRSFTPAITTGHDFDVLSSCVVYVHSLSVAKEVGVVWLLVTRHRWEMRRDSF